MNHFEDYIDWYLKNASFKVANEFVENIKNCLVLIANNHYIARMVDEIPELREYAVQRFPFLISYLIKNKNELVITSFLHQNFKKTII